MGVKNNNWRSESKVSTIHFHQKLIKGVVSFIVSHAISTSCLPHCINLINKHNAWSVLSRLCEQLSYLLQMRLRTAFQNLATIRRTLEGPTPTNISMKSEPDIEKKGTEASPAAALAKRVLPVPGGPTKRAP